MKKLIDWIRKHWKLILGVFLGIAGAIAALRGGTEIVNTIRRARIGKVTRPSQWKPVAGLTNMIEVRTSEGREVFELPNGVTSERVRRVAVSEQGDVTVEVDNETIQRR